jgi:dGTPase
LRVVTQLENRYAKFTGLNLTWETLEGLVKHNGPLIGAHAKRPLPPYIKEVDAVYSLELASYPSAEAQVAAIADDIAYNSHDVDDGLRAGLFMVEDLATVPWVYSLFEEVKAKFPHATASQHRHEAIRRLLRLMVVDALETSKTLLTEHTNLESLRHCGHAVVAFSPAMDAQQKQLKAFLFQRMYRHYRVNRMTSKAHRVISNLFHLFLAEPQCLPTEWQAMCAALDDTGKARVISNYIAGMTDRYALKEHQRLFDVYAVPL